MPLAGKVAVITGAANGIGLGTARALAARGARLVMVDIDGPCSKPKPRRCGTPGRKPWHCARTWPTPGRSIVSAPPRSTGMAPSTS